MIEPAGRCLVTGQSLTNRGNGAEAITREREDGRETRKQGSRDRAYEHQTHREVRASPTKAEQR
jgi:hypothetical protein